MIGITSFGAYVPRLRLNRMSIVEQVGWFAPAIVMVAQGERSFCNWDEDSLTMAVAAARDCLTGRDKSVLDAALLASTTLPFADRQNAGILRAALNLGQACQTADFGGGLRCGTTALLQAMGAVKSGERKEVLVAAADKRLTRTAYFYEMWFGDGAAALTVGSQGVVAEYLGGYSLSDDFVDHYRGQGRSFDYMWEERWVRDAGYSRIIPAAVQGLLADLDLSMDQVAKLVFPCFFSAEHAKIAAGLGAKPEQVGSNLHEACGETGSAHPLLMLVGALQEAAPGDLILAVGFGQGADALAFRVTEAIADLAPRRGLSGTLAHKKQTTNYTKFLKFRDLLETEMGIRAEAPTQTAMTVLHRRNDMLLGMVGGRCTKCGNVQFPRTPVCVNPDCRAVNTQEPHEFADAPARVMSFTGDLLAVSVDPPGIYGMVAFDDGGRYMADFTDCEMGEVKVGQPVRLAFRRRYHDRERGFTGYFWKAVPQPLPKAEAAGGMTIRFDGQVAIVTGAGAGLGRAYALELARRGAKVVVNDLGGAADGTGGSSSAADKVVAEIKDAGGEAVANYDSVATPDGGRAIVQTALGAWGRVDILVNNAGILRDKTLLKMEPDNWNAVIDVHLNGAYNVTRPAFQAMKEAGYGRIVFTTSAAGLYGNYGQTNYSAAKLGLVGFMNTLKLEGERYGIKANTVAPIAGTRLTEGIIPEDMFVKLKPEFVAPLVAYLCSRQCADTGLVFNAGAGYFNRAAMATGPGAVVGDGKTPPTLEEIHRDWRAIDDLSQGEEYADATGSFAPMLAAFSPQPKTGDKDPAEKAPSGVAGIFARMPEAFSPDEAAGVEVIFQFDISGPDGGQWHAEIKDQKCQVQQGTHNKPTTTIKMQDSDFLALIAGELNPMTAFTGGKLRIEGDLMKSQLIQKVFKF